jgi:hypothetical protein
MATPYPLSVKNYILPEIGSIGRYNLAEPYASLIDPNVNYTCQAIRSINEITASGGNPFTVAYSPAGITQAVYNKAQAINMKIVYLVSDGGNWVYVPANYILEIPIVGGVGYQNMGLNVVLGLINSTMDLSALITAIQDTVYSTVGITPNVQPVQLSNSMQITNTQASQIESARAAVITTNNTSRGLYLATLSQLADANAKIQALEQYIIANMPSTSTPAA